MSVDWGGSRLVAAGVLLMGALAPVALAGSAAHAGVVIAGSAVAAVFAGWVAWSEWRRTPVRIEFLADGRVLVGDRALDDVALAWQGPIAVLDGRMNGRRMRFLGWPDVIGAASRRELRLWALEACTAREPAVMAP